MMWVELFFSLPVVVFFAPLSASYFSIFLGLFGMPCSVCLGVYAYRIIRRKWPSSRVFSSLFCAIAAAYIADCLYLAVWALADIP